MTHFLHNTTAYREDIDLTAIGSMCTPLEFKLTLDSTIDNMLDGASHGDNYYDYAAEMWHFVISGYYQN
ncbi:MAG: hypothetical protein COA94_07725 [Rickettsiales bacterium]|nr:MAG: hypothetical protein COA94_07725 [Rickettsiales bacterium]